MVLFGSLTLQSMIIHAVYKFVSIGCIFYVWRRLENQNVLFCFSIYCRKK